MVFLYIKLEFVCQHQNILLLDPLKQQGLAKIYSKSNWNQPYDTYNKLTYNKQPIKYLKNKSINKSFTIKFALNIYPATETQKWKHKLKYIFELSVINIEKICKIYDTESKLINQYKKSGIDDQCLKLLYDKCGVSIQISNMIYNTWKI